MSYAVKEIYFTLQGEGFHTGRPAVFLRFAGCNLWSGKEQDRATAVCQFCDTEFVGTDGPGGGRFTTAAELARVVARAWAAAGPVADSRFTVVTGGEPLLQLDDALVGTLHAEGFEIAVETNGTRLPPEGVDWTCVSPKAGAELVLRWGDELKLVYPQVGAEPERYEALEFDHFFLQPMDGPDLEHNMRLAAEFCERSAKWRLSLQMHKLLGIR